MAFNMMKLIIHCATIVSVFGNFLGYSNDPIKLDIFTDLVDTRMLHEAVAEYVNVNFIAPMSIQVYPTKEACPNVSPYSFENLVRNSSGDSAQLYIMSCDSIQQQKEYRSTFHELCNCICYPSNSSLRNYDWNLRYCWGGNSNEYFSIARFVGTEGNWLKPIIFTDFSLPIETIPGTTLLHKDCKPSTAEVGEILDQINPLKIYPYRNIVIFCSVESQIDIIYKLYHSLNVTWLRLNLLLVETPEDVFKNTLQPLMRDGDNIAVIYTDTSATLEEALTTVFDTSGEIDSRALVKGCVYDCHTVEKLSSVADFKQNKFHRTILPGAFSKFYGKEIFIALSEYAPFYTKRVDENGNEYHEGLDINILNQAAIALNFRYKVVHPADEAWGSPSQDGNWTGMVGMVMRGEADMAAAGMSISYERSLVIDYSYQYYEEPLAVLLKIFNTKWYYFLEPFHWASWIAVILFPCIVYIAIQCFIYASSEITGSHRDDKKPAMNFSIILSNMILQGTPLSIYTNSVRILMSTFWLTVIVITATYSGNLTASLAVPTQVWPFTSLRGMSESSWTVLLHAENLADSLFKNAETGTYRVIGNKIAETSSESYVGSASEALEKVTGGGYAYVSDYTAVMDLMNASPECGLAVLPQTFYSTGIAFVLPKGSPYKSRFDEIIMDLSEAGLVAKWYRSLMSKSKCDRNAGTAGEALTLDDLFVVFLVFLTLGIIVATLALLAEVVMCRARKHCKGPAGNNQDAA